MRAPHRLTSRVESADVKGQAGGGEPGLGRNDCLSSPGSYLRTARITPGRLVRLEQELTERDREVLESLGKLRLVSTPQLERLHFTGGSPSVNRRKTQRVLARLSDLGLVVRLERRVGGVRAGSAGHVYALAAAGQRLITGSGPAGGQVRRPWTPSLPFVRHRLSITELYVRLVEAQRAGHLTLDSFNAEPGCWRRYLGPQGASAWLKPDAAMVTVGGDYEDRWFIEVDLGTESPLVLARKCQAYLAYRASGREQVKSGVFPLVLYVVPGMDRRILVELVVTKLAMTERRLFRVTTDAEVVGTIAGGAA